MLRGESPGFSRVAVGLLLSYDGDLRDLLVGPQGLSGPRSSSFVEAGNSRFLSRADMDLGVPLGRPQGSQASFPVDPRKSALLSNQKSIVMFPVGLNIGIKGYFSGHHRAVTPAIAF